MFSSPSHLRPGIMRNDVGAWGVSYVHMYMHICICVMYMHVCTMYMYAYAYACAYVCTFLDIHICTVISIASSHNEYMNRYIDRNITCPF